jgi:DNA topoisomerase-1
MALSKILIVVESPAKAKTINKFLGKDFLVKASMGHVRDLPKSRLGVDLENNFEPHYTTLRGRFKLLKELKDLAKKAPRVYLATDPDREGEAIGWHLATELKLKSGQIKRVCFREITPRAVQDAMERPRGLDMNLVDAQQARRVLDRLVGYSLSPLLWPVRRGLSAGRVQSVVLRLVVEREREILEFQPQEYWELSIVLGAKAGQVRARLWAVGGRSYARAGSLDAPTARSLAARLPEGAYRVGALSKKEQRRHPQAPYITSTLQQDAAQKLNFSAKKTMLVAQQLYEGLEIGSRGLLGLITYMRTDSVRVAQEAQAEARQWILQNFGQAYAPGRFNTYKSKRQGQDAHEAIRPTHVGLEPKELASSLNQDQLKLYRLIWTRFLASQMTPAVFDFSSAEIDAEIPGLDAGATFKANGSLLKFPGFLMVWGAGNEALGEENELPPLSRGEVLQYLSSSPSQHSTQAPARFNDASLVRTLEELGIGRPSTYAPILSTILGRAYVERIEGGRYKPTPLGELVHGLLMEHFQEVLDVQFTAGMEKQLDRVEEGEIKWQKAVAAFYGPFSTSLGLAKERMRGVKFGAKITPKAVDALKEFCGKCGKPLRYKQGRFGRFIGCSGYPGCKYTRAIKRDGN